jgi:hypothetical protein
MRVRWLSIVSSLLLASATACSSSNNPTCKTLDCPSGGRTYQICDDAAGNQEWKFGDMTCTSTPQNTAEVTRCNTEVMDYCAGIQGSGGTGGGGGGTGIGGGQPCIITLSGAVTGTFSCIPTTLYAPNSNLGGPVLAVTMPSPLMQVEATITRPGMPTSGTWTQNDSGAQSALAVQEGGLPPPSWICNVGGTSTPEGTYTMDITVGAGSPGPSGGTVYFATGTIDATLPFVMDTGASGVVNMHATF